MTDKQVTLAQIRYNTDSDGQTLCWRLILDGQEVLVESVNIEAPVFTSRDWMEDIERFKHHISVRNCCVTINAAGEAIITSPDNS
ncbi:hypothetical protein BEL04_10485 [Mucilaginibacter sp. PPCGB 2223]|uniref:hypothetical protein n=1 Tax=Mucilaginibacter sp. PPCGB 2223 TaxID=1886027 RepID=UPI000825A366|nr:hypothetical protein [Mucilaginibacter sp. PPCGB 2223]OCX54645.1 hypothetical protein BEL04_10485 [Mucilaginibacter sp. PPCGB 2223]